MAESRSEADLRREDINAIISNAVMVAISRLNNTGGIESRSRYHNVNVQPQAHVLRPTVTSPPVREQVSNTRFVCFNYFTDTWNVSVHVLVCRSRQYAGHSGPT